jgi:hypothetical protein
LELILGANFENRRRPKWRSLRKQTSPGCLKTESETPLGSFRGTHGLSADLSDEVRRANFGIGTLV